MNFKEKQNLKDKAIELYLKGYNFSQIADKLNYSRTFITDLIKDDDKIKEKRNRAILKVYKNLKNKKMQIGLSNDFLTKIGIDKDCSKIDYVDVVVEEDKQRIIIKKYNL